MLWPVHMRGLAHFRPADRLLAAGIVGAAAVEVLIRYHGRPMDLAINLPSALLWTALLLRRPRPLLMVAIIALLSIAGTALQVWRMPDEATNSAVAIIALLVVSYSLGAYASLRDLALGAALIIALIVGIDLLQPSNEPLGKAVPFATFFVVIAPTTAGRLVRGRTAMVGRLRAQTAQLEALRADQVATELAADRLRLSSNLNVRLVAGLRELAGRIGNARIDAAGVAAIEQTARDLLEQTRQIVVSLATSSEVPGGQPAVPSAATPPVRGRLRAAAQPWTALAAAALCAGFMLELHALPLRIPLPAAVLCCCVLVVPLAWMWVSPLAFATGFWALAVLFDLFVAPLSASTAAIGLAFVAPFALAALARRTHAIVGLLAGGVAEAAIFGTSEPGGAWMISLLSALAGAVLRDRTELVARLRANAARLDEQRDALAHRAVMQERARVARELHDAVGHSLTIVALQAGAARRLWNTDRARASGVVHALATVVADGLTELQAGLDPVPPADLGSLERIVARLQATGLDVTADLEDVEPLLEADARFVLRRVIQESLTNVLKHAPGASASVAVRDCGDVIDLLIANSDIPATPSSAGAGLGLPGMQARVAACGGRLEWGRDGAGGFRVHAALPVTLVRS